MGILDEDVARVRDATDLVALAGEHLALKRGRQPLRRPVPVPLGEDAVVLRSTPRCRSYYCFGCQASGDAITFVREVEHLDFVDAVERLASRAGHHAALRRQRRRQGPLEEATPVAKRWAPRSSSTTSCCCTVARRRSTRVATCDRAASTATRRAGSSSASRPTTGTSSASTSSRRSSRATTSKDAGLAFVNKANRLQDQFRGRLMFPIYDSRGDPVGFGGAHARRRGPEVQELAGDARSTRRAGCSTGSTGRRPRSSARGEVVICEGYTDVMAFALAGAAQRGGHLRHRARRRALPDPQEPHPQGGARLRLRRRRPGRGREVVRLGAALRDPAPGGRPARGARPRRRVARRSRGAAWPRARAGRARSCSSASTVCSPPPTSPRSRAGPARPRQAPPSWPSTRATSCATSTSCSSRAASTSTPTACARRVARAAARGARPARRSAARTPATSRVTAPCRARGDGGPDRVRATAAASNRREVDVLLYAVHDPELVADWLDARLFSDPHRARGVRADRGGRRHPRRARREPRDRCASCSNGSRWRNRSASRRAGDVARAPDGEHRRARRATCARDDAARR